MAMALGVKPRSGYFKKYHSFTTHFPKVVNIDVIVFYCILHILQPKMPQNDSIETPLTPCRRKILHPLTLQREIRHMKVLKAAVVKKRLRCRRVHCHLLPDLAISHRKDNAGHAHSSDRSSVRSKGSITAQVGPVFGEYDVFPL
jgi:hypothetical protein